MTSDDNSKAQLIVEWEARQSPIGFYNYALSYLETADRLTSQIQEPAKGDRLQLAFDSPIRHLYAQAWELALKACLFTQGIRPHKLRKDFGHRLLKAWRRVDKERFALLNLGPATEKVADHLDHYHAERMFAYPLTGMRDYLPLNVIKAESQRFRLERTEILRLFLP